MRLEKENEEINVVKMKLKEEEEMKRQAEYREMVRHV